MASRWNATGYRRIKDATLTAPTGELLITFRNGDRVAISPERLSPRLAPAKCSGITIEEDGEHLHLSVLPGEGDDGSDGIDIPWDAVRALTDGAFAKHMSRMSQRSTMRLGRKLQRLRGMRGITAAELASRVGMTQPAISRIENGHHDVAFKTLEGILAALDYTLADVAGLDVEDDPADSVSA